MKLADFFIAIMMERHILFKQMAEIFKNGIALLVEFKTDFIFKIKQLGVSLIVIITDLFILCHTMAIIIKNGLFMKQINCNN